MITYAHRNKTRRAAYYMKRDIDGIKNGFTKDIIKKVFHVMPGFLCSIIWILCLKNSIANKKIYLFCVILALVSSFFDRHISNYFKKTFGSEEKSRLLVIPAILLSTMVTVANWNLYRGLDESVNAFYFVTVLISGIYIFYRAIQGLYALYTSTVFYPPMYTKRRMMSVFVFVFCFCFAIDLLFLFLVADPGIVTNDSLAQINNILTGEYSNHHPVFNTMVIKLFIDIAFMLGMNINVGILFFCIFQSLFMSLIYAYCVETMCEMRMNKAVLTVVTIFYAIVPYNFVYSVTLTKDTMFAGFALILVISLFRIREQLGGKIISMILLFVSSVGFILFRTNGYYAYIALLVILLFVKFNRKKETVCIALSAFAIAVILRGPVLDSLNVVQPDTAESLSIPLQQIGRYVKDGGTLSDSERAYLNTIMDVDRIPDEYEDWISDPMKNLVRDAGGNSVIEADKAKFIKTWLSLGLKSPVLYMDAWVDMTRAYYNSSYSNGSIYYVGVIENDLGIGTNVKSEALKNVIVKCDSIMQGKAITGMGLCLWILVILMSFSLMNRDYGFIENTVYVAIVLTLLIATPVGNSFRYAYPVFVGLPFVLVDIVYLRSKCNKSVD